MIPHLVIDYTNHRGERAARRVIPSKLWYGSTAWHPQPQWLLKAIDIEKGEERDFAFKDIHSWQEHDAPTLTEESEQDDGWISPQRNLERYPR